MLQHRYVRLFSAQECDQDILEQFLLIDFNVLRSVKLTKSIPPPGAHQLDQNADQNVVSQSSKIEEGEGFRCTMIDSSGNCCNTLWSTKHRLMVHCRFSHGLVHILKSLVVTNQCMWCLSTFRSRLIAQQHVLGTAKSRVCKVDRNHFEVPIVDPGELFACIVIFALRS